MIWLADAPPWSEREYFGAPQTIQVMRRAVLDDSHHFETRQLVETICEGIDSKDYTSEIVACYQFILQRARYMRDPRRIELVRAPWVISKQLLGGHRPSIDCDDMATWLAGAVTALGGRAEFVTVAFQNMFYGKERQYSHVFTRAREPRSRQPIVLDPVAAERTGKMLRQVKAVRVWPVTA